MDEHTLRVLEFKKILDMASSHALTEGGKRLVQEKRPLTSRDEIIYKIELISECRKFLSSEENYLGIESLSDLTGLLNLVKPVDSFLPPLELRKFFPFFITIDNLKQLSADEEYLHLGQLTEQLTTYPDIKDAIEMAIDNEGNILDEASPELYRIRKESRILENRIKKRLEGFLNREDLKPHIQDTFFTDRNGRYVIPVKKDSKGSLPGVIHGISNSGETFFIEPFEIQTIGNEIDTLRAEEKIEEIRILRHITSMIREDIEKITSDYEIVLKIDSVYGLSVFANIMDMSPPEINDKQYIRIFKGRHPLLWMILKEREKESNLVALDFELGGQNKAIIITGSNAGGKTVTLKTVGVIVLMALSGMHTPSGAGTTVPLLTKVLADIGDEQSIEQSLSTFSAHMTRISSIIEQSGNHSLIIIDELGTGTDPDEGGALSCAMLRELKRKGALSAVSTHLGIMKVFAFSEEGMINGAMEVESLQLQGHTTYRPTYKLKIGEAGQSHAFEIASNLGISEAVIQEARGFIAGKGIEFEHVINELREKSEILDRMRKESEQIREEQEKIRQSLENELSQINKSKKDIFSKAYEEAESILQKTKYEARDIIDKIKTAEKKVVKELYNELDKKQEIVKKTREALNPPKLKPLTEAKKGQKVILKNFGIQGIVHSFNDKTSKCKVLVNNREIEVPFSDLAEPLTEPSSVLAKPQKLTIPLDKMLKNDLSDEIKLMGQRVDPALSQLERYLNDAQLSGFKQVKVIHGIGTGRLSRAIREFLKDHPLVSTFSPGARESGGDGVTIVYLKV